MTDDRVARHERRDAERRARRLTHVEHAAERVTARASTRAARREELLNAAVAGVRQHGAGASMELLAAEAGITKPILYRHFGDRAGLVTAIGDRFAGELQAELRTALAAAASDARATLVNTVDAFVSFVERDPQLYRYLVRNTPDAPPADESKTLNGFLHRIGNDVASVIGEQLRAAGRDSGGAEVVAHGIVGFVYAAGDLWVERPSMSRSTLVRYIADFLWSGLSGLEIGS